MQMMVRTIGIAVLAYLVSAVVASAQWSGDWASDFCKLRLLKDGDRLYGDYAQRGVIEGKVSADGRTARAVFLYNDGRWGTVEWQLANDRISGDWNWSSNGLPQAGSSNNWAGTRSSTGTSLLRYATQNRIKYPFDDPQFTETVQPWIGAIARGGTNRDPDFLPFDRYTGIGDWYGGYGIASIEPAFSIGLDVIHYTGGNTAAVDVSIYVNPDGSCPESMHTAFCAELRALADARGYVDVTVTGARLFNPGTPGAETLDATFKVPNDTRDRVISINHSQGEYLTSIHHPDRGYDFAGKAYARSHICEQTHCQDSVFRDVLNNPNAYRGAFDFSYVNRLTNLPNRIAQSHNRVPPAPRPQPQPAPRPRPLLSDAWAILDETSENLGEISVSPDGNQLKASGKLRGFFETGTDHDTVFTQVASTGEAVTFGLVTYAGQSGESKSGRLFIELPSHATNSPRGTLIVGEDIFLVELVRPTPGLDPDDVVDTPVIGIYSVSYRLRDVPLDRAMRLRKEPDRSSEVVGSLAADASGLQMINCDPEIYSDRFEQASFDARLAMLSSSWCQVTNNAIAGWLPGRYLAPEQN